MSDNQRDCRESEKFLLGAPASSGDPRWLSHLESCSSCREQWATHQMLVAPFSHVPVPELSGDFESGLQRKIGSAIEVIPLSGWRTAAMVGYAILALVLMAWVLSRYPLPSVSVDPSSPWILAFALGCVPLSLWLAIGLSRWLPTMRRKGLDQLSLL